jgi:hypothetical protein
VRRASSIAWKHSQTAQQLMSTREQPAQHEAKNSAHLGLLAHEHRLGNLGRVRQVVELEIDHVHACAECHDTTSESAKQHITAGFGLFTGSVDALLQ